MPFVNVCLGQRATMWAASADILVSDDRYASGWAWGRYSVIYEVAWNIQSIMTPLNWNALRWRHNGRDSVSNHQPYDCLLNRLFRRRPRKHQSSASLAFVRGIHRRPVNSPHKGPVTRKMFPFDDVIMMFCVTGPLWGQSTGHRWITLTKASDAGLWCFVWCVAEQPRRRWFETVWHSLWRHCNGVLASFVLLCS